MSTDPLPEPPWSSARGRPPRRRMPLSREAIVEAALRIVDRAGVDGLNMRAVADELETGPASLYAHIDNKRELLALVFDLVAAGVEIPEPDPARWREQLRGAFVSMRDVLVAHRDIARVALGEIPVGHNALRATDRILAIMLAGGLPRQVAAYAIDTMALYVSAAAFEEGLRSVQITEGHDVYMEEIHAYFEQLPASRFPVIAGMVAELTSEGTDRFVFGLDVLIAGLEAYAAARPDPA